MYVSDMVNLGYCIWLPGWAERDSQIVFTQYQRGGGGWVDLPLAMSLSRNTKKKHSQKEVGGKGLRWDETEISKKLISQMWGIERGGDYNIYVRNLCGRLRNQEISIFASL